MVAGAEGSVWIGSARLGFLRVLALLRRIPPLTLDDPPQAHFALYPPPPPPPPTTTSRSGWDVWGSFARLVGAVFGAARPLVCPSVAVRLIGVMLREKGDA